MNRHQSNAYDLLAHYFARAMGHRDAAGLNQDQRTEIAEIIQETIYASVDAVREELKHVNPTATK